MIPLWTCLGLEAALITGLLLRRRVVSCYSLLPLAAAWLVTDVSVALYPACNTWEFWITKELTHAVLAFAVGAELSWRALVASVRGQCAARVVLGVDLVFAVALVATAHAGPLSVTFLPRLVVGQAILYLGLLWVLARHALPLERLHRAVLGGMTVHGVLYWMTWSHTGSETAVAGFVNSVVFVGVLGVLVWAVWTDHVTPDEVQPEILRLVHPWIR